MQIFAVLCLLYVTSVQGFLASSNAHRQVLGRNIILRRPMSEEGSKFELVPLEKTNIENSVAVTGGILGFVLGGPVIGLILAAVTSYVAKKDNDSGEALRGIGKTVIESYNFINKLNSKFVLL